MSEQLFQTLRHASARTRSLSTRTLKDLDAKQSVALAAGIALVVSVLSMLLAISLLVSRSLAALRPIEQALDALALGDLSEQGTTSRTDEIGRPAEGSVHTAERAGALLDEMVPSIRQTSCLVQEIAAASSEQATGVSQINQAMTQMSLTAQQGASSSEELAATAEEMAGQSTTLQNLMQFFTLQGASARTRRPIRQKGRLPGRPRRPRRPASVDPALEGSQFERF